MLKPKLQYFGHLLQRADSLEKTLMLGKAEGSTRRGWQDGIVGWHHWLNWPESVKTLGDGEGQGSLVCGIPLGPKESDMTQWLNNKKNIFLYSFIVPITIPVPRLCQPCLPLTVDWTVSPIIYVELLSPNLIIFEYRAFLRLIEVNEVIRVGIIIWLD